MTEFEWQISLLGILGSFLIGIIKSPIRNAIFKKERTEEQIKKVENRFDAGVFLSTLVIAAIIGTVYTYFTSGIDLKAILLTSKQIWLVQNICYTIWKKLGIKRTILFVWLLIKTAVLTYSDKNKDGKICVDEASEAVKKLLQNGFLEIAELLNILQTLAPGILLDVLTKASEVKPSEVKPNEVVVNEETIPEKEVVKVEATPKQTTNNIKSIKF